MLLHQLSRGLVCFTAVCLLVDFAIESHDELWLGLLHATVRPLPIIRPRSVSPYASHEAASFPSRSFKHISCSAWLCSLRPAGTMF